MNSARSHSNTPIFFNIGALTRLLSLSLIFVVSAVATASAEVKSVKIMMDWIIQGTHAPFFVAQDKGYFKAEGIKVNLKTPVTRDNESEKP